MPYQRGTTTQEGTGAIAERLRKLRKARGMTQLEMAEKLGVVQSIFSSYENGKIRLHGELIIELAKILCVTTDELLGVNGEEVKMPPQRRRFLSRLEKLEKLPERDQEALVRTIDAFLAK